MPTEPAGYVAEYDPGPAGGRLCYAYGETREAALVAGCRQFAGASAAMQAHMRERLYTRALTADEASEIIEMLETPWS